jgi:acid phosphatase
MTSALSRIAIALLSTSLCFATGARAEQRNPFARIGHIVVIYTENRSFDHIFGLFPGAEGLNSKKNRFLQVGADGAPLQKLPKPPKDDRFPATLPNAPFALEPYVGLDAETKDDPVHDFYIEQEQIDGGRMDRFVEASNAGALVMGHYDGSKLKQWALAKEFTLADHFFHAAFGGSFLNHFYLVCACAPHFPDAPARLIARLDESGARLARAPDSPADVLAGPPRWINSGKVTPDFHAYGTLQPVLPAGPRAAPPNDESLPTQTAPTIGDRLSEKGVSWAWYAGGWDEVQSGKRTPAASGGGFMAHHLPFLYFAAYGPGTNGRAEHIKDAASFLAAADAGTLPKVSFYKPIGERDGHSAYSTVAAGDEEIAEVVDHLRKSPNWSDMLIIVTADENGGYWDHVPPPRIDRFGPGTRAPTLIISPLARKGYIDHTVYDTTSILRTIEVRFDLSPLASRDAAAADLRNSLERRPSR